MTALLPARAIRGLVVTAFGSLVLAASAFAQSAGAWELACKPVDSGSKLGCIVSTVVVARETGKTVLRVELVPASTLGNEDAVLRLHLPHGIALNANIGVRVDGGELFKIPLMSSTPEGLLAYQFIGADVVAAMKSGALMAVTVVNTKGETLTNSVSLVGLTLVLDSVERLAQSPVAAD